MDQSGSKERPQGSTLFPISEQARKVGLDEIGSNAAHAYAHEFGVIGKDNPHLQEFLVFKSGQKALHAVPQEYLEGAVFAHRIIRVHSALTGTQIPIISRAEIASHGKDMADDLRSGKQLETKNKERYEALLAEDPELGKALVEMIKYRASNADFITGVVDMHTLLTKALESGKLERMFNGDVPKSDEMPPDEL